ncbi:MAG: lysophospholipid acyltransferase family protein [Spirochaetota bacterium]
MRKAIGRFIKFNVIPPIIAFLVKAIYRSLSIEVIGGERIINGPSIVGIWHSDFFIYAGFATTYLNDMVIMTSYSDDGELLSRIIKRLRGDTVRGDERRHGARALIQIMDAYKRGNHIVFALDGPLGPRRKAKAGCLFACRKLGKPLLPVISTAVPAWRFNSWDRMFIPKPFSRARLIFGEPIQFPEGESDANALLRIEQAMEALYQRHELFTENAQ